MIAGSSLLLLLLAAPGPARAREGVDATLYGAREELEACAARIEQLKARHERGAELDRLLRRSQELAALLEDVPPPEAAPAQEPPSGDELRERADAARDEADRLAAEIGSLDVRIEDARRSQGEPGAGLARAAIGTAPVSASSARIRALLAERAALAERRARAEAEAARLDTEASAADRDR